MAQNQQETFQIGDDLFIRIVEISSLKEQDVNAQVMQPRHFERLTENIRQRGQVESLPYCHRPNDEGQVSIISGHHRVRAARAAGMTHIPVIIDTRPMRRSEIIAKQIAHNELHGSPDREILAQLVSMIDNVDDLLTTGLDEEQLPTVEADTTVLQVPHGEFNWRMVTLTFLPHQLASFKEALEIIDRSSDIVGVAPVELFEDFSRAAHEYGHAANIRNFSTVVATLTEIARREIEAAQTDSEDSKTPSAQKS